MRFGILMFFLQILCFSMPVVLLFTLVLTSYVPTDLVRQRPQVGHALTAGREVGHGPGLGHQLGVMPAAQVSRIHNVLLTVYVYV